MDEICAADAKCALIRDTGAEREISRYGKPGNANIAEIHNQVTMMLGHEAFDHQLGRTALVDYAFIIAKGEITKQAKNWIAHELNRSKRSQIMFMDREDILTYLL